MKQTVKIGLCLAAILLACQAFGTSAGVAEAATKQVVAFTAMANSGVTLWGYRTGDAPMGIEEVIDDKSPDGKEEFLSRPWYDLNGQRIKRPTHKGIYIIDKQKVLVR